MFCLKEDGAVSQDDKEDNFSWTEIIESIKSPHVWLLAIVLFFNGTAERCHLPWAHSTLLRHDLVRLGLVSFAASNQYI